MKARIPVGILGSGHIGTDLLMKLERSPVLEPVMMAGIDPQSPGLDRAGQRGVATTASGLAGMQSSERWAEIALIFDATSAKAHLQHAPVLKQAGKLAVDLTPAAVGPYCVPVANLDAHRGQPNVNMVTCGGQATIPVVWAASQVTRVRYGEIVASISSKSAGPGTRANIDEFTRTTAKAIEQVGGADKGKAIIVLNPAEPPLLMRDTVYMLTDSCDRQALSAAIESAVAEVATYVPGYRLVQPPVIDPVEVHPPGEQAHKGMKVTVLLEVEGAGDWLPAYAGNLDIMTSAAVRMGELMVADA
ncbi:MAG TPA: acetaldehyde dehydrogenase (acetylating) [Myxococcales bacterium]|nr:acetaldehyde dehydrogenase (acetylating) [Myxococcales bacterium]